MALLDAIAEAFARLDLVYTARPHLATNSSPVPSTDRKPLGIGAFLHLEQRYNLKATAVRHSPSIKSARLVIPKKSSKDQRPFIKVYAPDYFSGKLKLKKIYKIPGETLAEIKINAAAMILELNQAISSGAVFNKPKQIIEKSTTLFEIIEAYKQSQKTSRSYGSRLETALRPYYQFCNENKFLRLPIEGFANSHGQQFIQSLKAKTKKNGQRLSNRTINNYISYAKTIWIYANEISETPVLSPFEKIKKLPIENKRNVTYLPHEVEQLIEKHKEHPDLGFLAMFMYYSLARTIELTKLQVKHIGLYKPDQIYIPASVSKNKTERHVIIPKALQKLIDKNKIKSFPPEHYIFSLVPGQGVKNKIVSPQSNSVNSSRLGERYRQYILEPLGFSLDHTLYSWKHTGIVNAHNAGVPDADIMQQTGHKSYQSFTVYMKSLGLFARGRFADLIPEI